MVNLGLIGCGGLGRTHASCIAKIDRARFAAFADVVESAATAMLSQFGGDYATSDVQRVLDDPIIDAVYICTRHDSHASLAIAAARAGKHIFIEKPLALALHDCEAVVAEVQKAGIYLMPAFKLRYYPLIQEAHAFIPQPQVLVGQVMDARWADDQWSQDQHQGGANVHSQGCHTTDIMRYLAGSEPVEIWAAGGTLTHPGHPCIDQCTASIKFANGHVGSWIQGDAGLGQFTGKFFIQMFGDNRSVQLYDRLKKATFFDGQKTWTRQRDDEEGYQLENEAFIQALIEARPPPLTVLDGLQATRMVMLADRAIRTGQVQKVGALRGRHCPDG